MPTSIVYFLESLQLKARALQNLYYQTGNLKDLEFSLQTYQLCDSIIDENRQTRLRYEDKVHFGKTSQEVYSGAIKSSILLREIKNDPKYLAQTHYFIEKSKSAVLSESLSDSYAKKFSGLPEALLDFEQNLKLDKSYNQSLVLEMSVQIEGYDTTMFNLYQNKIFNINKQLDSLTLLFEKNHSSYYQLKYQNASINPSEIQEKISQNKVLLEYFESDSSIHVFAITKNKFWMESFEKDSVFKNSLNQYINSFDPSIVQSQNVQTFKAFTQASYGLHEKLLSPILTKLGKEIDHLIIAPTSTLAQIPWDLFIRSKPEKPDEINYKNLDYVLNDYSISYAHSASLLFQDIKNDQGSTESILAVAPVYSESNMESYEALTPVFRDELLPLKWNTAEVDEIGNYYEGDIIKGEEATEKRFKELAGSHRILHLAMHAFVDHENPMLSKLVFYNDNDSTEDGMLHTYELFNMDLSAEMVVLSTCKTGLGKIQKGEGVMSLGRAFSYAGSPSVVMSHWSVDDKSTSQLMTLFYKYISEGQSKDKALRQAKLDFLSGANGLQTHPYYWGSFAVMGNTNPLSQRNKYLKYLIVPLGLLLLVGYIYTRKKVRTS